MSLPALFHSQAADPRVERIRHEPKVRLLQVEHIVRLTPDMLRMTFSGEDLFDFTSLGFDDHVKIFAPTPSGQFERRDYTPRRYDTKARTLVIDFAVHDAGPATRWALGARLGDKLQIAGPKSSTVVSAEVQRWLLIGDETALPAIGRRLEESSAGTHITSVVAVSGPENHQSFETSSGVTALWAHRTLADADDPSALLAALEKVDLQPDTFVWIGAEATVARAIRTYLLEERHCPRNWTKTGGYWIKGKADAHERIG